MEQRNESRASEASLSEQPCVWLPEPGGDRDWELHLDRFSIKYQLIARDTMLSRSTGQLSEGHVDQLLKIQLRTLEKAGLLDQPYFLISDVSGLTSVSFRARRHYLRGMENLYQQHPFRLLVFFGANRFTRAAINVTKPFAPFEARIVDDIESAKSLIDSFRSPVAAATAVRSETKKTEQYVEELLRAMGRVSWDVDGGADWFDVDPEHPYAPVFDAIGLIKAEIGELIQERARAEEEQRKLQEKLARSRKMEALGLLAGGVAHELNNILSGIMTYPELLLMDETLDPKMRKAIETIRQSGQLAAEVVNDLVTIARGGAGARVPLLLNNVVKECLASPELRSLQQLFPSVTLKTDLDDDLLPILGSSIHIRKVVMNLVSNAIEAFYGESQGGTVEIKTRLCYVDRPIRGYDQVREGEYSRLSVSDDGIGIGSEDIERIFEPFYSKKVIGRSGTGLGLTMVWNTVQEHFGYIDVSSSPDGTRFDLYFPITREQAAEPTAKISLDAYRGNGETVLVIDDVENQRVIACNLLEALGYQAEAAACGEEAVEILRERPFDLILLDMIMDPGINGRETYERIVEIRPGQRAVIASGFSETEDVRIAQQLGAGPFIMKPYSLEKIGMAIRSELER
jgi:signal transduction histidine kinase